MKNTKTHNRFPNIDTSDVKSLHEPIPEDTERVLYDFPEIDTSDVKSLHEPIPEDTERVLYDFPEIDTSGVRSLVEPLPESARGDIPNFDTIKVAPFAAWRNLDQTDIDYQKAWADC